MLKNLFLFLVIQLIILLPLTAFADYEQGSAAWLLDRCQNLTYSMPTVYNYEPGGECIGYLTSAFWANYLFSNKYNFCAPENITNDQVARIVVKYLQNNPEKLNQPAMGAVITALHNVWPCLQQGKKP